MLNSELQLPTMNNTDGNKDESKFQKEVISLHTINFPLNSNPPATICLQNDNGPCPIFAATNLLSLKGLIKLNTRDDSFCMGRDISEIVLNYFLQRNCKKLENGSSSSPQLEEPDNMQAFRIDQALENFYKLCKGLDVNVYFTGVDQFEYTSELELFDMLGIKLYHGWVMDERQRAEMPRIAKLSYNAATQLLLSTNEEENDEEADLQQNERIKNFLLKTPAQVTQCGIDQLLQRMHEAEMAVFYWNYHYSVLVKHADSLFLLNTDIAYKQYPDYVWEVLSCPATDSPPPRTFPSSSSPPSSFTAEFPNTVLSGRFANAQFCLIDNSFSFPAVAAASSFGDICNPTCSTNQIATTQEEKTPIAEKQNSTNEEQEINKSDVIAACSTEQDGRDKLAVETKGETEQQEKRQEDDTFEVENVKEMPDRTSSLQQHDMDMLLAISLQQEEEEEEHERRRRQQIQLFEQQRQQQHQQQGSGLMPAGTSSEHRAVLASQLSDPNNMRVNSPYSSSNSSSHNMTPASSRNSCSLL